MIMGVDDRPNVRVNGKLVTGASSSGGTLLELGAMVQADSAVLGDKATATGTVSLTGGDALLATIPPGLPNEIDGRVERGMGARELARRG